MNTPFEEIRDSLLSMITSYEYLNYTEEELNEEFNMLMKRALTKFKCKKNIIPNYDMEEFNRELGELEVLVISLGMLSEWLRPKIYSITNLKPQLSMKDYQQFSNANMLKELKSLKEITDKDFHYWMQQYALQSRIKGGDI